MVLGNAGHFHLFRFLSLSAFSFCLSISTFVSAVSLSPPPLISPTTSFPTLLVFSSPSQLQPAHGFGL